MPQTNNNHQRRVVPNRIFGIMTPVSAGGRKTRRFALLFENDPALKSMCSFLDGSSKTTIND